jgi:hypothetical protein
MSLVPFNSPAALFNPQSIYYSAGAWVESSAEYLEEIPTRFCPDSYEVDESFDHEFGTEVVIVSYRKDPESTDFRFFLGEEMVEDPETMVAEVHAYLTETFSGCEKDGAEVNVNILDLSVERVEINGVSYWMVTTMLEIG